MSFQQAEYWCHFQAGNRPYCYAICYPNGIPFYVGKGRAQRLIQHGHCVRKDRKQPAKRDARHEVLLEIHRHGAVEQYAILALCDSDSEAYQIEAQAIAMWGRRCRGDLLTNGDDGQRTPITPWVMPSQPAIHVNGGASKAVWVVHPRISGRAPAHKGVTRKCPACLASCMHPGNVVLHGARCPECCHFFDADGEVIHQFWLENRPRVNAELCMPDDLDALNRP